MRPDPSLPFINLDKRAAIPLGEQLYRQLRHAILAGLLKTGARLPSSRALAADLAVSRNTVVTAFRQLAAEGFITGRVGHGSTVRQLDPPLFPRKKTRTPLKSDRRRNRTMTLSARGRELARTDSTSLLRATPPQPFRIGVPALDRFPSRLWASMVTRRWRLGRAGYMAYANTAGYLPLREALAGYLAIARGVRCDASQIVITAGAQQALALIARLLCDAGDAAWIENPGYLSARNAFRSAGLTLFPAPVDCDGLNLQRSLDLNPLPKLVYLTPSNQYPLGATMPVNRRLEILHWANRCGAFLVEDDYNSEFRYSGRPIPALQGLMANAPVIYVGTFSKVLFPALRIGYLVLPEELIPAFTYARSLDGIHSHSVEQAALAEFIADGHLGRHIRRMREVYRERREALCLAVRERLRGRCSLIECAAGMHSALTFDDTTDDRRAVEALFRAGVEATALSRFYLEGCDAHRRDRVRGLLLGFSGFEPLAIRKGVEKIESVLCRIRA